MLSGVAERVKGKEIASNDTDGHELFILAVFLLFNRKGHEGGAKDAKIFFL